MLNIPFETSGFERGAGRSAAGKDEVSRPRPQEPPDGLERAEEAQEPSQRQPETDGLPCKTTRTAQLRGQVRKGQRRERKAPRYSHRVVSRRLTPLFTGSTFQNAVVISSYEFWRTILMFHTPVVKKQVVWLKQVGIWNDIHAFRLMEYLYGEFTARQLYRRTQTFLVQAYLNPDSVVPYV